MKTIREYVGGNRYPFDFKLCSGEKGWAQFDTTQDASYFGTWTHPVELKTVSFTEGDLCVETWDSEAEYVQALRETVAFYQKDGSFKGIDPGLDEKLAGRFAELGVADLLYPECRPEAAACASSQDLTSQDQASLEAPAP